MMLPIEIVVLVSEQASDLFYYEDICRAFGLVFSRNFIYKRFHPQLYVPEVKYDKRWGRPVIRYDITKYNQHNYSLRHDLPSVIFFDNGTLIWYSMNNELHRGSDKPAIASFHNRKWFQNGESHRTSGPAIINDFATEWTSHNSLHRDDGPAVIGADGSEQWYTHGYLHRINGPAYINKSQIVWFHEGQIHNANGPAIITKISKTKWVCEWWYYHKKITQETTRIRPWQYY